MGDAWRQFRKHKLALVAIAVLAIIVLGVVFGPLIWTVDPTYIDIIDAYQISSPEHPWGTDSLGRDTLARAMQGRARIADDRHFRHARVDFHRHRGRLAIGIFQSPG